MGVSRFVPCGKFNRLAQKSDTSCLHPKKLGQCVPLESLTVLPALWGYTPCSCRIDVLAVTCQTASALQTN